VISWFQAFAFKWANLCRYAVGDLFTTEVKFPTEVFDMSARLKSPASTSIRQRVESFSSLLNEGALQSVAKGKITLKGGAGCRAVEFS
jgi:hypothetical protein